MQRREDKPTSKPTDGEREAVLRAFEEKTRLLGGFAKRGMLPQFPVLDTSPLFPKRTVEEDE